ncbi:MAG: hypothetical protein JEZ11_02905 [Desulfobacterales bacterium]|nr:hypothetical protein [Desulfobacterales bacterium]
MNEKRRLERYNLSMPTRIQSAEEDACDAVLVLETRDVCAGGAFFITHSGLPEGTLVNIEMVLPTERFQIHRDAVCEVRIQVDGTVVRSGIQGMAVRFDKSYHFRPVNGQAMEETTISGQAVAGAL